MDEHETRIGVTDLMGEFIVEIRAISKGDFDTGCNVSKEYNGPCERIRTILRDQPRDMLLLGPAYLKIMATSPRLRPCFRMPHARRIAWS